MAVTVMRHDVNVAAAVRCQCRGNRRAWPKIRATEDIGLAAEPFCAVVLCCSIPAPLQVLSVVDSEMVFGEPSFETFKF